MHARTAFAVVDECSWAGPLPAGLLTRTPRGRNFLVRANQMGVDIAARPTRHSRPRAGSRTSNLHGPGHVCPAPTPPDIDVVGAKKPGAGSVRAPDAIRKRHESATDLTFHRNNPTLVDDLVGAGEDQGGIVRSSALAVLRLTTSSNLVGCCTAFRQDRRPSKSARYRPRVSRAPAQDGVAGIWKNPKPSMR